MAGQPTDMSGEISRFIDFEQLGGTGGCGLDPGMQRAFVPLGFADGVRECDGVQVGAALNAVEPLLDVDVLPFAGAELPFLDQLRPEDFGKAKFPAAADAASLREQFVSES